MGRAAIMGHAAVTPEACRKRADAFLALGRNRPNVAWLCTQLARGWLRTAAELEGRDIGSPGKDGTARC